MQSFLQYRKFENQAREQYNRDKEKFIPEAIERRTSQTTTASSRQGVHALDHANKLPKDEEKAIENHTPASTNQHGSTDESNQPIDTDMYAPNPSSESLSSSDEETPTNDESRPDLARATTAQSEGVKLSQQMTGIQVRRRTTNEGGETGGQVFIVDFEGPDDPLNPHNWSLARRGLAVINVALIGWIVGFASAVDSGALDQAAEFFGVGKVAESLATGLFLVGFGVGGLTAGPLSEEFGRSPVYIGTFILYMIFIMASGLAPNFGAQIVFRFIAGYFAATPLSCAGGSVNDLFNARERVWAFPIFANAAFMGPIFGPIVGGFIGESSVLEWQWVEWVTLCISGGILASLILIQPETYPSTLLRWRAAHLRKITGDDRFRASVEVRDETLLDRVKHALVRPFILLIREPIVLLIGLYLTVIYIILFTFLDGYTYIFGETYGFSQGITGLCFLGIVIGLCCASTLIYPIYQSYLKSLRKAEEEGHGQLPPEIRLRFAMYGAPAVPISMFWMGWTAYPQISFWSPLVASVLFGFGILCIFISSYQYLIDAYGLQAASALSAVTLIRYVAAGGMVEVAIPMYENLGVHYTMTVLGGIAALVTPIPYVFFLYGHKIRSTSKYAPSK